MKWTSYLSSKAISLCFIGLSAIVVGLFLFFSKVSKDFILILFLLFLLLLSLWLVMNFLIENNRIKKMQKFKNVLLDGYLLGEVIPLPTNLVEKEYYKVIKSISQSAIGAVEEAKNEKEEYYDYVEGWIHEIKTPLTACSLILANGGDSKKLKTELKKADNLTESILYYARMRTAEKDTQIREIQVRSIIEESIKNQMEILIASKIKIDVEGDFKVFTDSKTLCFILQQLLINCAKYNPGCHIKIIANKGVISVEDNGIGIPQHEVTRVMDRGFTGSNGKNLGGSTGMGLYIVHELCKRMNMEINIISEINRFTKVNLLFLSLTKL